MTIRPVLFSICIILSHNTFAKLPPRPAHCPDTSAIIQEGVTMAESMNGGFITGHISSYNTKSNWGFILFPIAAKTQEDALKSGNKLIKILQGSPHPAPSDHNDGWTCMYHLSKDYFAAAVTLDEDMLNIKHAVKRLR